ncbi:MAG: DUF5050 domain-containing protein, partial [Ethanoligenens sp.]
MNQQGNSGLNLFSGINVTSQGDWLYYSKDKAIFRVYDDLSQKTQVGGTLNFDPQDLNIIGNELYFSKQYGGPYRMSVYDTEPKQMTNDECHNLTAVGDTLYYINTSDNGKIYGIHSDGTSRTVVVDHENIASFQVYDGKLYYVANYNLFVCDLDGKNEHTIFPLSHYNFKTFTVQNNTLYID